jgi:microcystin-dependent protein
VTGSTISYAGANEPAGGPWLPMDGRAVSRTQYAALFAALGTVWGAGDGSSTFNLPDMRGRYVRGMDNTHPVGTYGGSATHTLSIGEMPSHTHVVNDPGHDHNINDPGHHHTIPSGATAGGAAAGGTGGAANTGDSPTGITVQNHVTNVTLQDTGGGAAFPTEPPFAVFSYWIKT